MLCQRIGAPVAGWNSQHFASSVLRGLEGDVRVKRNTIIVTYYNAPNSTLLKKTLRAVAAKTGQGRRFNNNPLAVWVKFRFLVQVGMQ
tara:strand:+ start:283 stop:546 length:264 start_codon:yes stop_codon:yes gene_type:complete